MQSLSHFPEQRGEHCAPLVGQHEVRPVGLDQISDDHVLSRGVRHAGFLPIGIGREAEKQDTFRDVSAAAIEPGVGLAGISDAPQVPVGPHL